MTAVTHLLPEHNHACERARLSNCNCFCHGAGHQLDLIQRAVSCTVEGENSIGQLSQDLRGIYGGFHQNLRDEVTPSRRSVPDDLASLDLGRGRGASWVEKLLVDEALHTLFLTIGEFSTSLSASERQSRERFVVELAEGALRIVGQDVETYNICDGHVWCSIVAEANSDGSENSGATPAQASPYGRICYPRNRSARVPRSLSFVRVQGVEHVRRTVAASSAVTGVIDIVRLLGAASCPDLWHHPAAVRHSLRSAIGSFLWPPPGMTLLATAPQLDVLAERWGQRGNW